jgi:hypothetical protein
VDIVGARPTTRGANTLACMAPRLIVLDESKQRRHRILSVGGVVVDLGELPAVETSWADARQAAGIERGRAVKYSMNWPGGPNQRAQLIAAIGQLPLQAVIALLEDFRPLGMKARKATRKDAYIQRRAFEWVLQRLAGDLFIPAAEGGPHLVMIDGRDDFSEFQEVYASGYQHGWPRLPYHPVAPLREHGFSAFLGECSNGPVHEIADLLTSCVTRWADERCIAHKGGKASDLAELDGCMADLLDLFPIGSPGVPPRRCGHSFIVHAGNRTGKELLHDHLDRWAHELEPTPPASAPADDIPF